MNKVLSYSSRKTNTLVLGKKIHKNLNTNVNPKVKLIFFFEIGIRCDVPVYLIVQTEYMLERFCIFSLFNKIYLMVHQMTE
jgi:hypothetical protein